MKRWRDATKESSDPWRLRREVAAYALKHGAAAAAREFGAGVSTVRRLLGRFKKGSLDAPDRKSTGRYLELVKTSADPWRLRRDMVASALKHGVEAAAREFGAGITTVRRWLRRAREGPWKKPGSARWCLTPAQVERIVRAKIERPDLSAQRLKEEFGIPHGTRQIKRVLRERGLSRPWRRHDPELELRSAERRVGLAQMHLVLRQIERARGMDVPRYFDPAATLRRIAVLERAVEKKRAMLERARRREAEKKRKKKGGRGGSA